MSERARLLALLEHAHVEAQTALAGLEASWREEDMATSARRQLIWAAHEQGARDRDAMRVQLGGASLIEAQKAATEEAASKRLAAADAEAAGAKRNSAPLPAETPAKDMPTDPESETASPGAAAQDASAADEVKPK